jgi:lysozyme
MQRVGVVVALALAGCGSEPGPTSECTALGEQAVTTCPGGATTKGVDVSHYDGAIDWPTAHAAGVAFAFAKATESSDYIDPDFATNWAAMKSSGVVRGAYHFFHPDVDPTAQMTFFLKNIASAGGLEAGDLPPAIDFEVTNGVAAATIAANLQTAIAVLHEATGMKPIVYSSPSFADGILPAGFGSASTLWVANWQVSCPNLPTAWTSWAFWQSASTGMVAGISSSSGSAVDLDEFNGTLAQLQSVGGVPSLDAGAGTSDSGLGSGAEAGTRDASSPRTDAGAGVPNAGGGSTSGGTGDAGGSAPGRASPCPPR